ncbi:MAG TPA: CoA pyrophosphatase [Rhodocyclaceae bacterium]|nr:CoA pyrophosphatase [Rhodocyclaceae bacterium]
MISIDTLASRLQTYRPRRMPGRRWVRRCGVVLLLAEHGPDGEAIAPALLMMRRTERLGDPWSGHVSFPGGRVNRHDVDTRAAALRELHEETGFAPLGQLTPIGRLSDRLTREHARPLPMVISPYVYRADRAVSLQPSAEAARLWWAPLSHLLAPERRRTVIWRIAGVPLKAPAIDVGGARLWGLSLAMAKELLRAAGLTRFR